MSDEGDTADKWICDSMVDPECDELFDSEEEMKEHKREDHNEPSQRRMVAPDFGEKDRYKIEGFIGIEVSDIETNHGQPLQAFECPFCQEKCYGFDLYEGCSECGATFKIIAEHDKLPELNLEEDIDG